jgi:hypothetical protein
MKPLQVVLDTSVLVAAVRSSQGASFRILQLVGDPRWELNLSPALLFEYEEVAAIHAKKFWREPERLADLLDFLIANSNRPKISYSWRPFFARRGRRHGFRAGRRRPREFHRDAQRPRFCGRGTVWRRRIDPG